MAGYGFDVDLDSMRQVAGQMAEANQRINAEMQRLMGELSSLPGMWQGDAATSFFAAKSRWDEMAQKHNQRLASISQGLTQTHGNYSTTDESNAQGFTGFTGA